MRNLALSSLFILTWCIAACSPEITKGFRKTATAVVNKQALYPVFGKSDSTQLFNMQIDFRKNHFSGLLLVKPTGDDAFRMVFNTHFGMSVFDFEFDASGFKINNCIEALNRKQVLQTLENDFRNLFLLHLADENRADIYTNKENPELEVNKINKAYYLKNNESQELLQMYFPHCFSSLYYHFSDYRLRFPGVIRIRHSVVGLSMQLDKITK